MAPKPIIAKVFRGTPRNLARLSAALKRGELVAAPTETVYGLAGDALNPRACRAIFRAKGRPINDPLIVHVSSLIQLEEIAHSSDAVRRLAKAFWPGPLTLVLPKKPIISDLVTAGRPSVAVRMPRHALFLALLKGSGRPLAAPSANPFGYVSPTTAQHVWDGLGTKIRYILDGGEAEIGLESTILDLRDAKRPKILRPGAIESQALESVLEIQIRQFAARKSTRFGLGAVAPGMLSKHYSPETPFELHGQLNPNKVARASIGDAFLFIFRPQTLAPLKIAGCNIFWLAEAPNLAEAAHALFATMRKLDQGNWTTIHTELAPGDSALALAINDRLIRAAAKR